MSLKIEPCSKLDDMVKGEEVPYSLDVKAELGSNTVKAFTFKIFDGSGVDVSEQFSGGYDLSDGVFSFGVKAHEVGTYSLEFWVTCNEFLPDGTTPYEFAAIMSVTIL